MKRRIWSILLALALSLSLGAPLLAARPLAAGNVYFTAVNDSLCPLNDSTMPFWSGGNLYLPSSVFSSYDLGLSYVRDTSAQTAILYSSNKVLEFDLARGGANVVLCYAGRAEAAQETVTACEDLGAKALAVQCNVADEAQVKALMDAAVKEFGRIDILVNNAGVTRDGLVMMMKEADFDAVIDTNLKGTFLCMKAVSRIMMKQRYGRIVNLSSVVGLRGNAGQVNYAASKAGVVGMTKSLAKELASRGVTVNAVAPGFIETDMTAAMPQAAKDAMMPTIPMQRLGAPEDVAKAVAFLASDEAAYVTGQVLAVDGGMAM
mgnify:CR=1 FL=1